MPGLGGTKSLLQNTGGSDSTSSMLDWRRDGLTRWELADRLGRRKGDGDGEIGVDLRDAVAPGG